MSLEPSLPGVHRSDRIPDGPSISHTRVEVSIRFSHHMAAIAYRSKLNDLSMTINCCKNIGGHDLVRKTRTSLLCAARPSFLQSSSPAPSLHRHSRYYLTSGNVVFRVADVLFRVWDEPLRTNSQFFSDHFLPSRIPFGSCIGCDDAPIVIDGVEPYQFDRLLGVIFPPFHRGASSFFLDYGFEEWLMVLDIATKWGFFGAREIALREISHSHPKPLDIVVLCDHYPLPTSWHMDALCHFVEREQSITVEEAHVLGEVLTVTIFTAREILGEKGRRNGEYVEYVITELFDIDITPDCY